MELLPIRLLPGQDLRRALEAKVAEKGSRAAFVLSGIGSLEPSVLRFAGACELTTIAADTEILTLSGSISVAGSHLHASVSDAQGTVIGGHVAYGCTVRTTAEVLLALLSDWHFSREPDPATGYDELVVRPAARPTTGDGA
jgi:predicted DNA-binding protein with PD1-like motif